MDSGGGKTMGVFTERLFAVFILATPWGRKDTAGEGNEARERNASHDRPASPTWQTWDMRSPTTSTMRADLEALRTYTRVR
jgi:hypothetical protein